ncbi:MAG: ABC-2 type transport system permease protein [Flavobacteriales bacterium]|jgi:ABC-2 type transport system permease protein
MLSKFSFWPSLLLARTFLKMFFRDKQSIFFSVFFPIIFMLALGLRGGNQGDVITIGLINQSQSTIAEALQQRIQSDAHFKVIVSNRDDLLILLASREIAAIVTIPASMKNLDSENTLSVLIDSAQLGAAQEALQSVRQRTVEIERDLRGLKPALALDVTDVQTRNLRYIDFLLPGLLAFSIMQISIAGSGYNLVEYRRKGILKRLFVTPVRPIDVILGLVGARLLLVMLQITFLLIVATQFLGIQILGSLFSVYFVAAIAGAIFLSLGFALGSIAKTQASIQALGNLVIFPQMLFSGMFYPISSLPEFIQPIANILPLSFVANAMRDLVADGTSLFLLWPDLLGMAVCLALALVLATRLFVWRDVAGD